LPRECDCVLISTNPSAGSRSGQPVVDRLIELLRNRGFSVEVLTDLDRLAACSASAFRDGRLRAVVAAGGDGTAAAVANFTAPGVPIMVLPLGTENLLSKYLELKADPAFVCDTIDDGATVQLDAGRAGDRIFLLMVGCGFDADVVRRLHRERSGHIHHLSYTKPILDSIRSYQYPQLRVYCELPEDGHEGSGRREIRACWAFVANLPRYAGGLRIVPDAVGTDGLLDVCTFREGSLWYGLVYLGGVVFDQHRSWESCVTARTRRVRIEADEEVPYQLDGDPGGVLPVDIEILPGRLTLIVPRKWASEQGFVEGKHSPNP